MGRPLIASVSLKNTTGRKLTLTLEPWANDYPFPTGARLDVVEKGGNQEEAIQVDLEADRVVVYGRAGGTMSVFRDGHELP